MEAKTISTRRNRKQEYINSLNHDINWFTLMIADQTKFLFWVHGDRLTKNQIRKQLVELLAEEKRVFTDKTYKPWKDNPID